jgi:hypothetical protein
MYIKVSVFIHPEFDKKCISIPLFFCFKLEYSSFQRVIHYYTTYIHMLGHLRYATVQSGKFTFRRKTLPPCTLKMVLLCASETLVSNYTTKRCHNSENQNRRPASLTSQILFYWFIRTYLTTINQLYGLCSVEWDQLQTDCSICGSHGSVYEDQGLLVRNAM